MNVSYEANYFNIRPFGAYSISNVSDLSYRERRNKLTNRFQERAAWQVAGADKITTLSQASRERILREIPGVRGENIAIVPGAADAIFSPIGADNTKRAIVAKYLLPARYFLYLGEPTPRKNLGILVSAFQQFRKQHPDVSLVMCGCTRSEVKASLEGIDLAGTMVLGYVPKGDLPAIYRAALALIYPSAEEGFGLPIIEAMRTGQVVITSRDNALVEVAGDVAIEVTPEATELFEAMMRVINMPAAERGRALAYRPDCSAALSTSWASSAKEATRPF